MYLISDECNTFSHDCWMLVFLDTDKAYHNRLDTILKEDVHPHIQLVHSEECILGIDNYSILIIPFGYDQWNHRLSPLLGGDFSIFFLYTYYNITTTPVIYVICEGTDCL